ncbi:hypothetical protein FHS29_003458 [Saccharothrix tamanrassetensis]|uniref:Uncharacterized protein n=1 Tax=Saccharothrix tamanrassetensis TaxID=1051531 RepID=A0A841CLI6_9PSEU|nr:hypothetical protein [Saccharothrix tamanrassetensis]MBB5956865.1 hypothetical protein [Saccharothrix tamanrassetensis]
MRGGYRDDRIGWREMTAVGDGVALVDPSVPGASVSGELRMYRRTCSRIRWTSGR